MRALDLGIDWVGRTDLGLFQGRFPFRFVAQMVSFRFGFALALAALHLRRNRGDFSPFLF
jgi:hypothetical protein